MSDGNSSPHFARRSNTTKRSPIRTRNDSNDSDKIRVTRSQNQKTNLQEKTETDDVFEPKQTTKIQTTPTTNSTKMTQKVASEIFSIVMNSLPEFKGADSQNPYSDLKNFITKAEWTRTNMVDPNNHNIFDQVIQFKLVGDAQRKTQTKNIKDFDGLKDTLHKLYSTTNSLEELRREFFHCKQNHLETTYEYGQKLITALEQYVLGFETKYDSKLDVTVAKDLTEQAMSIFKKGLTDTQLKIQLISVRKTNLEELIWEAVEIEKLISEARNSHYYTQSSTQKNYQQIPMAQQQILQPPRLNIPQHYQTLPAQQQQILGQMQVQQLYNPTLNEYQQQPVVTPPQDASNNKRCHFCDRPNHVWKDCRIYLKQQAMLNANPETPKTSYSKPKILNQKFSKYDENKYCVYCQRNGHDVSECRTKKMDEEKKSGNLNNQNFQKQQTSNAWSQKKPATQSSQQQQQQQNYSQQQPFYYNQPQQQYFNQQQNKIFNRPKQTKPTEQNTYVSQNAVDNLGNEMGQMRILAMEQNNDAMNNYPENSSGSVKNV